MLAAQRCLACLASAFATSSSRPAAGAASRSSAPTLPISSTYETAVSALSEQ